MLFPSWCSIWSTTSPILMIQNSTCSIPVPVSEDFVLPFSSSSMWTTISSGMWGRRLPSSALLTACCGMSPPHRSPPCCAWGPGPSTLATRSASLRMTTSESAERDAPRGGIWAGRRDAGAGGQERWAAAGKGDAHCTADYRYLSPNPRPPLLLPAVGRVSHPGQGSSQITGLPGTLRHSHSALHGATCYTWQQSPGSYLFALAPSCLLPRPHPFHISMPVPSTLVHTCVHTPAGTRWPRSTARM